MSTERDELAELFAIITFPETPEERDDAEARLRAMLPKQVSTVAELDALPGESVIRDEAGLTYEKDYIVNNPSDNWWIGTGRVEHFICESIALPATVLFSPDVAQ